MTRGVRQELKLDSFLPYMINNLADRISAGLSVIYADEYDVTIPEWRILANLAQHRVLNAKQIVEFTGMEKSKVSRAVNNLTERGIITQQRTAADNRAKDLALTPGGETLYREIVPKVLDWESEPLNCLSVGEYRDLLYVLDKLRARVAEV